MIQSIVVLFATVAVVYGNGTQVSPCTNHGGELPIFTEMVGCATPPCSLPQLQDAVLNVVFRAPKTMRRMRSVVTAYMSIGPVTIPIPYDLGENSQTCNFLMNTYCPVMETEVVQTRIALFIESTFPVGTAVTMEFRINNEEDGIPFVCIRLPIQVAPPLVN